jgi:hypothetical protein
LIGDLFLEILESYNAKEIYFLPISHPKKDYLGEYKDCIFL